MAGYGHTPQESADGPVQVYNPDYQLTPASPLWGATHWHAEAGPPAVSIHAGLEVGVVLGGREEVQLDGSLIPGDPATSGSAPCPSRTPTG